MRRRVYYWIAGALIVAGAVVGWPRFAANSALYKYEWGTVSGTKSVFSFGGWRFGGAEMDEMDESKRPPKVYVHIDGKPSLLAEVTEAQLQGRGFESNRSEDGSQWYLKDASRFGFKEGRLRWWGFGPLWTEKIGLRYSAGPDSTQVQFPLSSSEVEALFGEPRETRYKMFVN